MNHEQPVRGLVVAMSLLALACAHSSNDAPPLDNGVYVARESALGKAGAIVTGVHPRRSGFMNGQTQRHQ